MTHEYRVEGPVMIFLTTTAIDIDEELLNRCLVLTVDEEREQTRAIHRLAARARARSLACTRRRRGARSADVGSIRTPNDSCVRSRWSIPTRERLTFPDRADPDAARS